MIIVNQKKDGIANFNNVKKLWINVETTKVIANYAIKTHQNEKEEKEVLKAIKAAYQANKILECSESISQNIIAEKFLEAGMIAFEYNMPEN